MPLHSFTIEALAGTAWKNGGGVTREIACVPAGAGLDDFEWRVSIARIAQAGPFSAFAGIDRVITLLAGPGVRLRSGDGRIDHRLDRPLAPFAFPGECPIDAQLLGGPCDDLNVMVRRGRHRAAVQVFRAADTVPPAAAGVLLVTQGRWSARAGAGEAITIEAGGGVWWHEATRDWSLSPQDRDGALVAVLIFPAGSPVP